MGTASSSLSLNYFGAKKVCLSAAPLIVATWVLFYFATGIEMALVARIVSGFCYGSILSSGKKMLEFLMRSYKLASQSIVKVYSPEVSHKDWRGVTSSIYPVLMSFGILLTFVSASFIRDWRVLAALLTIPPTIFFVLVFFMPESPYWLVEQGQNERAKKVLIWLRGQGKECDKVINFSVPFWDADGHYSVQLPTAGHSYFWYR